MRCNFIRQDGDDGFVPQLVFIIIMILHLASVMLNAVGVIHVHWLIILLPEIFCLVASIWMITYIAICEFRRRGDV